MEKPRKTKSDAPREGEKIPDEGEHAEIKTDYPLSEKDEIKKAEERLRKNVKKAKT